jgi:hypothetical protein
MKFFSNQYQCYCSIDLHARKMCVCIIDHQGILKMHQNIKTDPKVFFELIKPCMNDLVVGVECVFCWYWLADLCHEHKITFVLGHVLYMKAIQPGTCSDVVCTFPGVAMNWLSIFKTPIPNITCRHSKRSCHVNTTTRAWQNDSN